MTVAAQYERGDASRVRRGVLRGVAVLLGGFMVTTFAALLVADDILGSVLYELPVLEYRRYAGAMIVLNALSLATGLGVLASLFAPGWASWATLGTALGVMATDLVVSFAVDVPPNAGGAAGLAVVSAVIAAGTASLLARVADVERAGGRVRAWSAVDGVQMGLMCCAAVVVVIVHVTGTTSEVPNMPPPPGSAP